MRASNDRSNDPRQAPSVSVPVGFLVAACGHLVLRGLTAGELATAGVHAMLMLAGSLTTVWWRWRTGGTPLAPMAAAEGCAVSSLALVLMHDALVGPTQSIACNALSGTGVAVWLVMIYRGVVRDWSRSSLAAWLMIVALAAVQITGIISVRSLPLPSMVMYLANGGLWWIVAATMLVWRRPMIRAADDDRAGGRDPDLLRL